MHWESKTDAEKSLPRKISKINENLLKIPSGKSLQENVFKIAEKQEKKAL
jgi:hypothetical protein